MAPMFGLEASDEENSPRKTRKSPRKVARKGPAAPVFPVFAGTFSPMTTRAAATNRKTPKRPRIDSDDTQQILDVGQAAFGPTQCSVCQMFFEPKHGADVARHDAFHTSFLASFKEEAVPPSKAATPKSPFMRAIDLRPAKLSEATATSWRAGLVTSVWDFADGKVVRCRDAADDVPLSAKQEVALRRLRGRVEKVTAVMNAELGFTPEAAGDLWKPHRSVFLYLSVGVAPTICGLAVVDTAIPSGARRILKAPETLGAETGDPEASANSSFSNSSLCVSETMAYRVEFGFHRVWVHPSFRRRRLATRLLDAVRFHQGTRAGHDGAVPKTMMAFTEPTEAGRELMADYCGGLGNVLIYDPLAPPPPKAPRTSSPKPLGLANRRC